jgi:regulatory protein
LARGKFRNNEWGRLKIIQALKKHHIPEYCIKKALTEIDPDEYERVIKKLILSKSKVLTKEKDSIAKKKKIIAYVLQKDLNMN